MIKFLLVLILLVLCWPIALAAAVVWLLVTLVRATLWIAATVVSP
jgi:hypothetical protein